jgi:ClpP class serine protease
VAGLFDLVGVNVAAWKRGQNADLLSFEQPWTEEQVKLVAEKLRFYYEQFLQAVATGRGLTVEQVDEVAQGRVWLGSQAIERKLVDEIGGIHEAILAAKHSAGRDPDDAVQIRMFPQPSFLDRLLAGVLPRLPVYTEVGAPPGELAEAADEDPVLRVIAPILLRRLGAAVDLLPFASGEPLTMLPYHIEWGDDVPRSR